MKRLIKNNIIWILGAIIGAVCGFLYWKNIGCASGICMITSNPINSTIYGALMGGLLFSIFQNKKKQIP
ncbi:MAG: hypothetical protein IPI52_11160 [Bacteroidetes bacterium]|nr:hypothetical protein [Bacteroidota bacterium]